MSQTKKMVSGVASIALVSMGLAGCSDSASATQPPLPQDSGCSDWEYDWNDGVYECDDSSSSHYRSYYHGGKYYASKSSLHDSSSYKQYKNSSSFKSSTGKGGFGSSSSFGG